MYVPRNKFCIFIWKHQKLETSWPALIIVMNTAQYMIHFCTNTVHDSVNISHVYMKCNIKSLVTHVSIKLHNSPAKQDLKYYSTVHMILNTKHKILQPTHV